MKACASELTPTPQRPTRLSEDFKREIKTEQTAPNTASLVPGINEH